MINVIQNAIYPLLQFLYFPQLRDAVAYIDIPYSLTNDN